MVRVFIDFIQAVEFWLINNLFLKKVLLVKRQMEGLSSMECFVDIFNAIVNYFLQLRWQGLRVGI